MKGNITEDKSRGLLFVDSIVLNDRFYLYFAGEACCGDVVLWERTYFNYFDASSFLIEFFGLYVSSGYSFDGVCKTDITLLDRSLFDALLIA